MRNKPQNCFRYVAKFGVKMMEEANNGGRIVNISSLAGHLGSVTKA